MSNYGNQKKYQTKEQCMKCRCIVKERIIDDEGTAEEDCDQVSKMLANELRSCLMAKMEQRKKNGSEKLTDGVQQTNGCDQRRAEKQAKSRCCR